MKIPQMFLGTTTEVRKAVRPFINKYLKGKLTLDSLTDHLDDLLENDFLVETQKNNTTTGHNIYRPWIFADELLNGVGKLQPKDRYSPADVNMQAASFVPDLLRFAWSTLAIICDRQIFGMFVWNDDNDLKIKVIDSTILYWDEYSSIGKRFYTGGFVYFNNEMIFNFHISLALSELNQLLAQGGVSKELRRSGFPFLDEIVDMYNVRENLRNFGKKDNA